MDFVASCRCELQSLPHPPQCVFVDLLEHVPDNLRSACGLEDNGAHEKTPAELKKILPDAPIKLMLHCVVHGRAC
eukprot:7334622-Alexandrium_andersonii.AAC.1